MNENESMRITEKEWKLKKLLNKFYFVGIGFSLIALLYVFASDFDIEDWYRLAIVIGSIFMFNISYIVKETSLKKLEAVTYILGILIAFSYPLYLLFTVGPTIVVNHSVGEFVENNDIVDYREVYSEIFNYDKSVVEGKEAQILIERIKIEINSLTRNPKKSYRVFYTPDMFKDIQVDADYDELFNRPEVVELKCEELTNEIENNIDVNQKYYIRVEANNGVCVTKIEPIDK